MKTVPTDYNKRLADMGGRLPDGTPKLRLVFSPETKRVHGRVAGQWKYPDPANLANPLPWWFLETWIPPQMCGTRETWPYKLFGPYPADCQKDCCNGGYWGLKMPITTNGEFIELSEATMQAVERKQYMDVQFSMLTEAARLEALNEQKAAADKRADDDAWEEHNVLQDRYLNVKEAEDNADNRAFVFPTGMAPQGKNIRLPIGKATDKL